MVGVVVSWSGECSDHLVQEALCAKMAELGEVSRHLYRDFLKKDYPLMNYDGCRIEEKLLLSKAFFENQPIPSGIELVEKDVYLAKDIGMFGLEFELFDPRRYLSLNTVSCNYTVSFVFLRCLDPMLNGRMVQVNQVNPEHPLVVVSKQYLTKPELDLRYYLESWIEEFLGWVKHFYLPNMNYWAWVDNPGDDGYEQYARNDFKARDEIFLSLREALVEEARSWSAYVLNDQQPPNTEAEPSNRVEHEDERLKKIAQEEKRRRKRST